MKNIKTNGFAEMSVSEMQKVDGGIATTGPAIPMIIAKYIVKAIVNNYSKNSGSHGGGGSHR